MMKLLTYTTFVCHTDDEAVEIYTSFVYQTDDKAIDVYTSFVHNNNHNRFFMAHKSSERYWKLLVRAQSAYKGIRLSLIHI